METVDNPWPRPPRSQVRQDLEKAVATRLADKGSSEDRVAELTRALEDLRGVEEELREEAPGDL